ncbi:MAG: cell division protein FtsI (penicillin-binding protein 3) [Parcubacteria group bacterium Gr01-1014_18]|nr:MAG: cell division protein FtsI (penicillin-binding protein 3) [Parcubacteria group bacterium Greene0416_36]TSC81572.1 MAG: cell division protein FtsI (penicillin-binding protein 3) [Parcubacteria group bacterium Gr01-1014_18]TSC99617.1 MAG: cell division protein FtsI (penicillin-binding protein 3) [Parcubacteria group bacterium Greene1014_20]TSD07068.1 MAG: cell division protein FtsI (penicillin-binding protein 3) [Parcubacteria group bacterium Greene0714_2]
MSLAIPNRFFWVGAGVVAGVGFILWRLFSLQFFYYSIYANQADEKAEGRSLGISKRGNIYLNDKNADSSLFPVAVNKDLYVVYAVPSLVTSPEISTKVLAGELKLEESAILPKLIKADDPYEPIASRVEEETAMRIKKLNMSGIGIAREKWRYYPSGSFFSHIVGFVGYRNDKKGGVYGVEGYYDDLLGGGNMEKIEKESGWQKNPSLKNEVSQTDSLDLVLSIDRNLQFYACNKLKEYVEKLEASGGNVIVMNPKNGAIWALCNYPTFDPNEYSKVGNPEVYNNMSIIGSYEPGSTFKVMTMAAALDSNALGPGSTYNDEGKIEIGPYTIKNVNPVPLGDVSMITVLEKSLNTGAIYAAKQAGFDSFRRYLEDFGFGAKTGIDLDYESSGDLSTLDRKSEIYLATASFGQGITVTPIQLLASYGAVANGGRLFRPYVVEQIVRGSDTVWQRQAQLVGQVISPRTAALLGGMLVTVIAGGQNKQASVQGYYLGGKTGTAQISDKTQKGYSEGGTIQSFVGFGPVDDPFFVMLTKIDEPKKSDFAGSSAAPLFGEIAKFLLEYYHVPK